MSIVLDGTNGITSPEINSASGNLILPSDLSLNAVSTEARAIEVGGGRTGDGASYVDLIGDATYTDFGARFSRSGGANATTEIAHRGSGDLRLSALEDGAISVLTSSAERMRIDSLGRMTVPNQPLCVATIGTGWLTFNVNTSYGLCNGTLDTNIGGFYVGGAMPGGYNVVHVPVSGMYEVTSTIYKASTTNNARLVVQRNNTQDVLFTHMPSTASEASFNTVGYIYMNAGDYLNYAAVINSMYLYHAAQHTQITIRLVS